MAPLAVLAMRDGFQVTGSDQEVSANTRCIERLGAAVRVGHSRSNVQSGERPLCVLATSAVPHDHEELVTARYVGQLVASAAPFTNTTVAQMTVFCRDMGVPVVRRKAWWPVASAGRDVVAVAGTHGKTTVSSLTAFLLQEKVLITVLIAFSRGSSCV